MKERATTRDGDCKMKDETTPTTNGYRLKRRQFLANLLFAGGALSLSGLQAAHAQQNPTDGWTLPDLSQSDPKPTPTPPPTRGEPIPQPPPPPPPGTSTPPPPTPDRPAPPPPRGKVVLPPKGDYSPPKPGETVAPPPPKK